MFYMEWKISIYLILLCQHFILKLQVGKKKLIVEGDTGLADMFSIN